MRDTDVTADELDRHLADESVDDAALGALLRQVTETFPEAPSDEVAARHLAAIVAAAEEHAHLTPVAAGAATAWRRRVAHVLGLTTVKIGLGVGVAVAATGGLAATGSLPDGVQRAVADGAERIGVHFPYPQPADGRVVEELPEPTIGVPAETPASDRAGDTDGAVVDPPPDDAPLPAGPDQAEAPDEAELPDDAEIPDGIPAPVDPPAGEPDPRPDQAAVPPVPPGPTGPPAEEAERPAPPGDPDPGAGGGAEAPPARP